MAHRRAKQHAFLGWWGKTRRAFQAHRVVGLRGRGDGIDVRRVEQPDRGARVSHAFEQCRGHADFAREHVAQARRRVGPGQYQDATHPPGQAAEPGVHADRADFLEFERQRILRQRCGEPVNDRVR